MLLEQCASVAHVPPNIRLGDSLNCVMEDRSGEQEHAHNRKGKISSNQSRWCELSLVVPTVDSLAACDRKDVLLYEANAPVSRRQVVMRQGPTSARRPQLCCPDRWVATQPNVPAHTLAAGSAEAERNPPGICP